MRARVPLTLSAFGDRKTLLEWTQDSRCQVSMRELRTRIERGWSAEEALSTGSSTRPTRARNLVSAFGEEKSVADWARDPRASVSALTIAARVHRGWDHEEAITTAVHGKVRPPRPATPRPPSARRPRILMSNEPISDLTSDDVIERMRAGAELWFAGSSGDRVSVVHHDDTILISTDVLEQLESTESITPVCRIGSLVQYGLSNRILIEEKTRSTAKSRQVNRTPESGVTLATSDSGSGH